jgi:hypothetical protein
LLAAVGPSKAAEALIVVINLQDLGRLSMYVGNRHEGHELKQLLE